MVDARAHLNAWATAAAGPVSSAGGLRVAPEPTDPKAARALAGARLADALEATLTSLEGDGPLVLDLRARLLRAQASAETAEAQLADLSSHAERERQAALRAEAAAEAARTDGRVASQHAAAARAASDKALADTTAAKKEVDAVTKSLEGVAVAAQADKTSKKALIAASSSVSSPSPTHKNDARPKLRAAKAASVPAAAHLTFQRTILDEACDAADAATTTFRDALLAKAEAEHGAAEAAAAYAAAQRAVVAGSADLRARAAAFEADLAAAHDELEAATKANGALMADVERLRAFVDEELDALTSTEHPDARGNAVLGAPGVHPAIAASAAPHLALGGGASPAAAAEAGGEDAAAQHAAAPGALVPVSSPSTALSAHVTRRVAGGLASGATKRTVGDNRASTAAARLLAAHDLIFAVHARGDANAASLAWLRLCLRGGRGRDGAGGVDPPPVPSYPPSYTQLVAARIDAGQLSPAAGAFFAFCSASLRSVSLPVDAVLPLDEAPFASALSKLDGLLHLVRGEARDAAAAVVGADGWLSFELFEAAMKQKLKKPSYLPLGAEGLTVMRWRTLLAWAIKVDFRG